MSGVDLGGVFILRKLLSILTVVTMLLVLLVGQVSAKDYWVYTHSGSGMQYYVSSEGSDFRPGYGNKHAKVKIVEPKGRNSCETWKFGYDEGEWYFSTKSSLWESVPVRNSPPAQAILNFGLAHWSNKGFVE